MYNESLPMKSYQFFKIYKRFFMKKEKTVIQQSMRKEKQNFFFLFNRLFYEALENGFFVHKIFFNLQTRSQRKFCFLMSG